MAKRPADMGPHSAAVAEMAAPHAAAEASGPHNVACGVNLNLESLALGTSCSCIVLVRALARILSSSHCVLRNLHWTVNTTAIIFSIL